ncbi:MlaD family protein [Candidatus Cardinium sp. TP]|uniref:MlaD family protein n=1 Tax=Candidatus Cardinium sp. TP TaxID=2961955 RepID=UPI0021AFA2FF|nr:MlaD family protein [Candidatus Cardinium sp. TP]MCT4697024.1 MlaD family protein [Candidatus Cardinium sp. TP]MDN5246920.1 MlaD family protein [Candidatus Cardinium sp.]
MKINKNYMIGLLAFASLGILYYGFLFLKGHNIFSKYNDYQIIYPVNKNLYVSAPVKLKGHVVGMVTKVEIKPKQNYSTLVTIELDKQFPLTDTSKVMLNNAGMMEGNALEIELHKGNPIGKHDIIIGQLHPDFNEIDLKAMTAQVATVTQNLIKTTEGVNSILVNLEKTSATLHTAIDELEHNITTIAKNMIAISSPLADSKRGIPAMLPILHGLLREIRSIPFKDLSFRVTNMLKDVETLIQHTSNDVGSFGLLIHDPTLYHNLNHSAENLNALLFDLKKRPSRYVHFSLFGCRKR